MWRRKSGGEFFTQKKKEAHVSMRDRSPALFEKKKGTCFSVTVNRRGGRKKRTKEKKRLEGGGKGAAICKSMCNREKESQRSEKKGGGWLSERKGGRGSARPSTRKRVSTHRKA